MVQSAWTPVQMEDVDLLTRSPSPSMPSPRHRAMVLVRAHTRVVGVTEVELGTGETVDAQRGQLMSLFRADLEYHRERYKCQTTEPPANTGGVIDAEKAPCLARRRRLLAGAPTVSVVVATHNRPALLAHCLDSLLAQQHPALEIVVVDNARSDDTSERLVQSDRYAAAGVHYVREDVPGLGRAHNAGLAHARGDVIAITDDDVLADRYWLSALLEALVEHDAACVSGLILPLELRTREQSWVEQYGGFSRGFRLRSYSIASPPKGDPLFPFTAGRFGSGANMAFTRECLDRIGGFDPALGAGTKAQGGDDLAAFARTLLAGFSLVYQPDAVVRHRHHETYASLERMARGYGVGLGAYLTALVWDEPRLLGELVRRLPHGVRHLTSSQSDKNRNRRADYPRRLVRSERLGLLQGPASYVASRRDARRRDLTQRTARG